MDILKFISIFFAWFLSSLFINVNAFYQGLIKPFITPSSFIFRIIWPIIYFLITLSIVKIIKKNKLKNIKPYLFALGINYILNQLFPIIFFKLNNLFLSFLISLGVFISSINLFIKTYILDIKASKLLIFYIIWSLFATILAFSILVMN